MIHMSSGEIPCNEKKVATCRQFRGLLHFGPWVDLMFLAYLAASARPSCLPSFLQAAMDRVR